MGKDKQRFNKKQSVRFTLVPSFDENDKPITLYRPVQSYKSKLSSKQREKIISQISDEKYDQIQINGKKVNQNQIPAFILQQIRGRKDLVFNQKNISKVEEQVGDMYEITDVPYDQGTEHYQDKEWIDQKDIIDEDQYEEEYTDEEEYSDEQFIDEEVEQQPKQSKLFVLKVEDFPMMDKVNIDGKDYELTQQQIKLLDVIIPENYQQFEIQGVKFEKYDENGFPISQKAQYQEWLATGKEGIVDQYVFIPERPIDIYDNDMNPSQITGEFKQIQDALNYDGEQDVYEEMQDDFFAKMIKNQVQLNKKKKKKKENRKKVASNINPEPKEYIEQKLPKILEEKSTNKQNVFAKYDDLDEQDLQQQLTDEMLDKALDDFENNLQPESSKMQKQFQNKVEQMQEYNSQTNMSMNFSEIESRPQYFGKDGELDWRCLTKKEKKQYMKTKIIRDFYEEVRQREIEDKLKGKKNVKPEELHLKTLVSHLSYEEDHVMRRALQEHAKEVVDLDEQLSYETSSDQEDIVEYRQRTSVISSNLAEVSEPTKKKKKALKNALQRSKQLGQMQRTLCQLKVVPEKRNRKQTSQQRKQRKERLKEMKKNKKQIKKEFAQKFSEQRRKHMKMSKPSDPLHKISFVKII